MPVLFLMAGLVFLLDRLSKNWVVNNFYFLESVPVIPGFLHLTYIRNPGAAFGILPEHTGFFIVVTLAVAAAIVLYGRQYKALAARIGFGLLLGGALGNLVDRVRDGSVIDFVDLRVFPVFNVADASIVIGVILAGWHLLRDDPAGDPGRTGGKEGPAS